MSGDPDPRDQRLGRFAGYALVLIRGAIAGAICLAIVNGALSPPWFLSIGVVIWPLYLMFLRNRQPQSRAMPDVLDPRHPNGRLVIANVLGVIPELGDEPVKQIADGDDADQLDSGDEIDAPEGDAA